MTPVETFPGMGGEKKIKENCGGDKFKYEIFNVLQELL
jgi:hypothetical protein